MQKCCLFQGRSIANKARGTKGKRRTEGPGRKEIFSHFRRQPVAGTRAACVFLPGELPLRNAELPALYQSVKERSNWQLGLISFVEILLTRFALTLVPGAQNQYWGGFLIVP